MRQREFQHDRSETRWLVTSLAVVGTIAVGNLLLGSTDFSGVLMIGPLIASTQVRPRRTALVGGAAVVVAAATMVLIHEGWEVAPLIRFVGVAAGAAFAVAAARWREERERRLHAMTRVAHVAQRAILAPLPRAVGPVRLATRYRSATAEAVIGGDFYDAIETASGLRVIVGDVKGKGLHGVRVAVRVLGAFRLAALRGPSLDDVAHALNDSVSSEAAPEDFVTALLLQVSPFGTVEAVNCGHLPPLLVGETPKPLQLAINMPLGLADGFVVERFDLTVGDRLLLYTDGLVEARSNEGAFFNLEAAISEVGSAGDEEFLDSMLQRVESHTGGSLGDDMALLTLSWDPATSATDEGEAPAAMRTGSGRPHSRGTPADPLHRAVGTSEEEPVASFGSHSAVRAVLGDDRVENEEESEQADHVEGHPRLRSRVTEAERHCIQGEDGEGCGEEAEEGIVGASPELQERHRGDQGAARDGAGEKLPHSASQTSPYTSSRVPTTAGTRRHVERSVSGTTSRSMTRTTLFRPRPTKQSPLHRSRRVWVRA